MTEQNKGDCGPTIPPDLQERAKTFIAEAFRFFAEQLRALPADVAEFERKRQETQARIRRGARRSDGKIV